MVSCVCILKLRLKWFGRGFVSDAPFRLAELRVELVDVTVFAKV